MECRDSDVPQPRNARATTYPNYESCPQHCDDERGADYARLPYIAGIVRLTLIQSHTCEYP
jgi:hypothetical protein